MNLHLETENYKLALDYVVKKIIENHEKTSRFENEIQAINLSSQGLSYALSKDFPLNIKKSGTSSFREVIDEIFTKVIPLTLNDSGGGYFAYIPGSGIPTSVLADMITTYANQYIGVNFASPGFVKIEMNVLKWFIELFGFDSETSGGVFTSGGSLSNLQALLTARHDLLKQEQLAKGVAYFSKHTHHSMIKAAYSIGISKENIRIIEVDADQKINVRELELAIDSDIKNKLIPFFINGNAGTTSCGSIDNFSTLSWIARKYNCWLHVDAAYGGFFQLTEAGKKALEGIHLADSITLDPHKSLFMPYGTGAVIFKDRMKQKAVFQFESDYLKQNSEFEELWNFSELSMELTRNVRGLRVLLPLQLHGVESFRKQLELHLAYSEYLYERLICMDKILVLRKPDLTIINFRYKSADRDSDIDFINLKTACLLKEINKLNRVHLSGATIDSYFTIRICVLSFRTNTFHLDYLTNDLTECLRKILP